jgi:hypothetical protein
MYETLLKLGECNSEQEVDVHSSSNGFMIEVIKNPNRLGMEISIGQQDFTESYTISSMASMPHCIFHGPHGSLALYKAYSLIARLTPTCVLMKHVSETLDNNAKGASVKYLTNKYFSEFDSRSIIHMKQIAIVVGLLERIGSSRFMFSERYVILFTHFECAVTTLQESLRSVMGRYPSLLFMFVSERLSSVISSVTSRCTTFRCPLQNKEQLTTLLSARMAPLLIDKDVPAIIEDNHRNFLEIMTFLETNIISVVSKKKADLRKKVKDHISVMTRNTSILHNKVVKNRDFVGTLDSYDPRDIMEVTIEEFSKKKPKLNHRNTHEETLHKLTSSAAQIDVIIRSSSQYIKKISIERFFLDMIDMSSINQV